MRSKVNGAVAAAVGCLLVAGLAHGQALFFTGSNGNQVWRASADGAAIPVAIYSPAAADTRGPIGIAWAGPGTPLYFTGGRNPENYAGDENGAVAPAVLAATTGDYSGSDVRHDVAVDAAGGRLFFSIRDNGIYSCTLPCGGLPATVLADSAVYIGIEYEPFSDRVYFTRDDGVIAWVPAAGGAAPTILFDEADGVENDAPRNLILDPYRGRVFWAQHADGESGSGEIMGANLDGTGTPQVLYTSPSPYLPFGVELDVATNQLFWTEFDDNSVGSNDRIMVASATGAGTPTPLYTGSFGSIRGIVLGPSEAPAGVPAFSNVGVLMLLIGVLAAFGMIALRGGRLPGLS